MPIHDTISKIKTFFATEILTKREKLVFNIILILHVVPRYFEGPISGEMQAKCEEFAPPDCNGFL